MQCGAETPTTERKRVSSHTTESQKLLLLKVKTIRTGEVADVADDDLLNSTITQRRRTSVCGTRQTHTGTGAVLRRTKAPSAFFSIDRILLVSSTIMDETSFVMSTMDLIQENSLVLFHRRK